MSKGCRILHDAKCGSLVTPNCRLFLGFLRQQLDSGIENGKLTARHYALERECNIPYHAIKNVIKEAIDAGLVEITAKKAGSATTFRLIEHGERLEKQT